MSGRIPVLLEAAEDKAYRESNPLVPIFVDVMKHAKIRNVTPVGDEVWFNNQTQERPYAMFELRLRALEGKLAISDILNEAEKYVNKTLDEGWARAGG